MPSFLWATWIILGRSWRVRSRVVRSPWIALAWVVGVPICAAAVWWRTRRVEPGLAALGFAGVLLVLLSVADTRANFRPDIYLTGARFMFLMPMGAWVVVHHTLATLRDAPRDFRSGKTLSHRLRIPSAAAISVIAVCILACAAVAQASFRSQVKPLIAFGLGPGAGVQMQDASELLSECATVTGLYRKYRAQVLVSLDQPFAYGCAAQSGLNTLFPPFERRPSFVRGCPQPEGRSHPVVGWHQLSAHAAALAQGGGLYAAACGRRAARDSAAFRSRHIGRYGCPGLPTQPPRGWASPKLTLDPMSAERTDMACIFISGFSGRVAQANMYQNVSPNARSDNADSARRAARPSMAPMSARMSNTATGRP